MKYEQDICICKEVTKYKGFDKIEYYLSPYFSNTLTSEFQKL
jgi:hypothetical protein